MWIELTDNRDVSVTVNVDQIIYLAPNVSGGSTLRLAIQEQMLNVRNNYSDIQRMIGLIDASNQNGHSEHRRLLPHLSRP